MRKPRRSSCLSILATLWQHSCGERVETAKSLVEVDTTPATPASQTGPPKQISPTGNGGAFFFAATI